MHRRGKGGIYPYMQAQEGENQMEIWKENRTLKTAYC